MVCTVIIAVLLVGGVMIRPGPSSEPGELDPRAVVHEQSLGAEDQILVLSRPSAVASHQDGWIVADAGNDRVVLVDSGGSIVTSWGGAGTATSQFLEPTGAAILISGELVVADTDNDRVQIFAGDSVVVIGSRGTGDGEFVRPVAVEALAGGGFLVADEGNDRLQEFTAVGDHVRSVTGLAGPSGLGVAGDGTIWVAESLGHRIRPVSGDGVLGVAVGEFGVGLGEFIGPRDVAVGGDGTLYVADTFNGRVQHLGPDGTVIGTLDLSAGVPGFVSPVAVEISGDTLAVSDSATGIIHLFSGVHDGMEPVICTDGYYLAESGGTVHAFGTAASFAPVGAPTSVALVDIESTPGGCGYWTLHADGSLHRVGDAVDVGSFDLTGTTSEETIIALSRTSSGEGLWGFTGRGRVLPVGDASELPSSTGHADLLHLDLNDGVVDSVVTEDGQGIYMVAADGGVFTLGTARFVGSVPGLGLGPLNAPVVGLVPDPDGVGYWVVAADGGVFSFEAPFRGSFPSIGGAHLNEPIVGMVAYGDGYLQVAADGGVFNFSDRAFLGSLGADPPSSAVVAIAPLP